MTACVVVCTLLTALAVAGIDSAEDSRWLREMALRLGAMLFLGALGCVAVVLVLASLRCPLPAD